MSHQMSVANQIIPVRFSATIQGNFSAKGTSDPLPDPDNLGTAIILAPHDDSDSSQAWYLDQGTP